MLGQPTRCRKPLYVNSLFRLWNNPFIPSLQETMQSTKFSIDELLLFHEVLRSGSLTKASENLQLAKSTVSRRLANLEKQIGALLLKRNTRRLVPTEVGLALFERCKTIVNDISSLDELVADSRDQVRGVLRISIPNEFGSGWLGKAISEFALRYPELQLDIEISTHPVSLIDEPYDVAISFGKLSDSRLVSKRLATLKRGIYASADYLQSHPVPKRFEDLEKHSFIVTDVQQRERTLTLRDHKTRKNITPAHRIKVNSMRLARELVLGGVGLAILPRAMCVPYVRNNQLVPVLASWECPPVQAMAVVLAREGIPRRTRVFLDFISEYLTDLDKD